MTTFSDRTPQGQADLLWGLLLIGSLVDDGLLDTNEGPFVVYTDEVHASLALAAAHPAVTKPNRETAVREAVRLMGYREGLREEDYEIVVSLLAREHNRLEWPG